ncbi:MAG: alpha/beta hydrolase [Clostridiales bacterium]|nr:alpha/beta hydrolase [Clostridiales bacterium]
MPLDPQVIEIYKNRKTAQASYSIDDMRKNADLTFNDSIKEPDIYRTEDMVICGYIPIRIYTPSKAVNLPVMLYFHGGGFVMHNIASHDSLCRKLSNELEFAVVFVGYRLAPEYKYPACMEDAYLSLEWVHKNAVNFGWDNTRIYLAGDSAGATICASLSLKARDNNGPRISAQVLFYGMFGASGNGSESMEKFGGGEYVLPREMSDWCMEQFIPADVNRDDCYLYPAKAIDSSVLPRTLVVTGEYDPLRDDGEEYFRILKNSGNDVRLIRMDGMMHGFMLYWNRLDRAKALIKYIAEWIGQ